MRAAIQISGEFRCLHLSLESFQKYVLNDLHDRGYTEICIFIHCWDRPESEMGTFPFDGRGNWHLSIPVYSNELGLKVFRPLGHIFEKLEDVKFLNGRSRILCMYYSIFMANQIRIAFEEQNNLKFDLVVRYRTDLIFESPLLKNSPDPLTTSFLVIPKSTIVSTCDGPFESTDEHHICDYIAYGTPDKMDIYCSTFKTWFEIPETPIGESCLAIHLKKNGVKAIRTPVGFYLVEGDGTKRGVVERKDFIEVNDPGTSE